MKKKVKLAGKYGSRYGWGMKKKIIAIEETSHATYVCPKCNRNMVRRLSAGIWYCRKCDTKIAGGSYTMSTSSKEMMENIYAGKTVE